jgi:elongation factor Ts
MAEISAKQVQALREKTGLAMMDCKKALSEASGDQTKALELLRKKFADKMTERADKEAGNGRIGVHANEKAAALAELRCETDFVANNDRFRDLANEIAAQCARSGITDVDQLKSSKMPDGRTVNDLLVDAFGVIKENMSIRRLVRIPGSGAAYVHHNGRVAAAITADKTPGEAGRQICMHIASTPVILGLVREQVDPRLVAEGKDKAAAESAGKPPQIIDKIVAGKMDKWFAERVLVEQPFVMDDKKSVGAFAGENGFKINHFVKYEVGGLS